MAHPNPPPPVRACLFDMDGLLISSEDLITFCIDTILQSYSLPLLPWSLKSRLQGLPLQTATQIVLTETNLPLSSTQYQAQLQDLHKTWFPTTVPLPGVVTLLKELTTKSSIEMALATSSNTEKFVLKTSHLSELFSAFPEHQRVLGDDARLLRHKPSPDIYVLALKTINDNLSKTGRKEIDVEECLVFEDSIQGVQAGRRAGMQVLWVPHPGLLGECRRTGRGRVDGVLSGPIGDAVGGDVDTATVVDGNRDVDAGDFSQVEAKMEDKKDGWARLLPSLEDFPYESYGIEV